MMLMEEINLKYKEQYDFFYLPIDFTVNFCLNIFRFFYKESV